jgi:esterase
MLVLHGILGSGGNWRSFARRVAEACPSWGFVLVDLRMHGLSQDAPPPHTVESAARDLGRLGDPLDLPVRGAMGHSFGGKVALVYAGLRAPEHRLDQLWLLDSAPGADEREDAGSARSVVRFLRTVPEPLPSRERFLELAAGHGYSRAMADWLAMNLRRADDGFRLRLDLDAIDRLLADYLARDGWPLLDGPPLAAETHVVLGGRSTAVGPADRARLAQLALSHPSGVFVHELARAGHWLHADDPDGLFELVRAALQTGGQRD